MANQKVYTIQINGLTESISAVESLNKQLDNLDKRINALQSQNIKLNTSSGGKSTLSEEEAIQREINKLKKEGETLDAKIVAAQDEIYKKVDATKQLYKETVADQKAMAAEERLIANTYSNTMQGIKSHLADLKAAINTTDLGDTEKIAQMTKEAGELSNKLKEMEQAYGQFGRNVGNYAEGVAEGLSKVKINVGGTVREFDSAKQAAKTLGNELKTMAVNGQTGTKSFKELQQTVLELESTMNDAKKPMDGIMDTMQSITAIASVGQGFRAFFGIDNAEIEKSLKRLMGLQTALKGISEINSQIKTKEGIGAWIAPFNSSIDKATAKLLTFNTALLGTGKVAKTAAVGINLFSKALKVAFSAGILIVVDLLVEKLLDLVENFKKVDEAAEREKEVQKDLASAYGEAQGKLIKYTSIVNNFNGSKKEEKKLVDELNKEFGSTLGTYKSLAEWQDVLKKKGEAYIQTLVNQAKAQAALNEVTAAYMNLENVKQKAANGDYSHWYQSQQQDAEAASRAIEQANQRIINAEKNLKKIVTDNEKYAEKNGLGNHANTVEKNGKKTEDAVKKVQDDIRKKEIDAMKDGLNKTLMQLDEEKRQTINKIKENGVRVAEQIKQVENLYAQLRLKAINNYLEKLTSAVNESAKKIAGIRFQIDTKDIELQINEIEEAIRSFTEDIVPINNTLTTKLEYSNETKGTTPDSLQFANDFIYEKNKAKTENDIKKYYGWLYDYASRLSYDVREKLSKVNILTGELELDYDKVEKYIENHYKKEIDIVNSYGLQMNASLSNSFAIRLANERAYKDEYIDEINAELDEELELRQKAAELERDNLYNQNKEEYRITLNALTQRKQETEYALKDIENVTTDVGKEMTKSQKETYDKLKYNLEKTNEQIRQNEINTGEKTEQIQKEYGQRLIEIENDINQKRQQNTQKYYDKQLSNYRDFLSKINNEASKQPVVDTAGFGIVNIAATKRNYREILDATKTVLNNVKSEKNRLNEDFKNGLISPENYNATLNQLNDLETETKQTADTVINNLKNVNADFVQSIQMYLQEAMNAFNQIMNAVWDAEDVAFDKEQEQIDKDNEALEKALDKQQEIVEKHKDAIDDIEDELATSRGDRRQHLIDQLNAEIEAQRAAAAEEKRLQKEKEKQQAKQDELDKKRKKAQYKRDLLQAIVNGAMAVTYAAINAWPIPAIPMMALAGAATAAQIAIMASNKPYANGGQLDGGQIVGKRHRDGGVKVLGGRAEVEGGEYITNRLTTAKNLDLLEYVNSKKKRIDISDMLEFYNGGRVKTSIQKVRTKFEDGGYIAPLPDTIDIKEQLQNIVVNQDNRPIYVSVVDINNKQADVRRVQTIAGLSE